MRSGTVTVDADKTAALMDRIADDVCSAVVMRNPRTTDSSIFQMLTLLVLLGILNYAAYILSSLVQLQLFKAISHIIIPVFPLIGCCAVAVFTYISAVTYASYLGDAKRTVHDMYIVLLGSVFLPLAIFVANISGYYILCYALVGLFSDVYCRKALTAGRIFENAKQKGYFVFVSLLMNLGFYIIIFPLFFP